MSMSEISLVPFLLLFLRLPTCCTFATFPGVYNNSPHHHEVDLILLNCFVNTGAVVVVQVQQHPPVKPV